MDRKGRRSFCSFFLTAASFTAPLATALPGFAEGSERLQAELQWRRQVPCGAAEIGAFDPSTRRLFATGGSGVTVCAVTDGRCLGEIPGPQGMEATSVACFDGVVAAAFAAVDRGQPGRIEFFDARTLKRIASFPAGHNPDMVAFAPGGRRLVCANEGEPTDDYAVDPEGSVTVIGLAAEAASGDWTQGQVRRISFASYNDRRAELRAAGVRIFGPSKTHDDGQATVAEDLEPEYLALSPDGRRAWATLQENDAVAVLDLDAGEVLAINPLGMKSYDDEAGLDASDQDGGLHIRPLPLSGLYQPDAIAALEHDGAAYLLTANEGDPRRYAGFTEHCRVCEFASRQQAVDRRLRQDLQRVADHALDRVFVSLAAGDDDHDGDLDRLCTFGGRSFSVWREDADHRLVQVYDSGSDFERILSEATPELYQRAGDGLSFDDRSPVSGPEPEGLVLARVAGRTIACIGLERASGIMLYDVTDPERPEFCRYLPPVDGEGLCDCAPEGLVFIDAANSPSGEPLLVVCHEVSGTLTAYRLGWNESAPRSGLGEATAAKLAPPIELGR